MDDVRAVMDAADCERAAVVAMSEGGPMALLFAATYPERVSALVLWATFARIAWAPDYPAGIDVEEAEAFCDQIEESWGHGRVLPLIATQDAPDDEATRRRFARFERSSATPAMAAAANRFSLYIDAREALGAISAPTLVIHRTGDPVVNVAHGRYLAEHIPGARFSEYPGDFHESALGRDEEVLDEIEEFLTGSRHDCETLRRRLGFTDPDPVLDKDPRNHAGNVLYGNEPLMLWAACPGQSDPAWLALSITTQVDRPGAVRPGAA
jgi:pimeloyl-ACP methyl ester carboxylesterase